MGCIEEVRGLHWLYDLLPHYQPWDNGTPPGRRTRDDRRLNAEEEEHRRPVQILVRPGRTSLGATAPTSTAGASSSPPPADPPPPTRRADAPSAGAACASTPRSALDCLPERGTVSARVAARSRARIAVSRPVKTRHAIPPAPRAARMPHARRVGRRPLHARFAAPGSRRTCSRRSLYLRTQAGALSADTLCPPSTSSADTAMLAMSSGATSHHGPSGQSHLMACMQRACVRACLRAAGSCRFMPALYILQFPVLFARNHTAVSPAENPAPPPPKKYTIVVFVPGFVAQTRVTSLRFRRIE